MQLAWHSLPTKSSRTAHEEPSNFSLRRHNIILAMKFPLILAIFGSNLENITLYFWDVKLGNICCMLSCVFTEYYLNCISEQVKFIVPLTRFFFTSSSQKRSTHTIHITRFSFHQQSSFLQLLFNYTYQLLLNSRRIQKKNTHTELWLIIHR